MYTIYLHSLNSCVTLFNYKSPDQYNFVSETAFYGKQRCRYTEITLRWTVYPHMMYSMIAVDMVCGEIGIIKSEIKQTVSENVNRY